MLEMDLMLTQKTKGWNRVKREEHGIKRNKRRKERKKEKGTKETRSRIKDREKKKKQQRRAEESPDLLFPLLNFLSSPFSCSSLFSFLLFL